MRPHGSLRSVPQKFKQLPVWFVSMIVQLDRRIGHLLLNNLVSSVKRPLYQIMYWPYSKPYQKPSEFHERWKSAISWYGRRSASFWGIVIFHSTTLEMTIRLCNQRICLNWLLWPKWLLDKHERQGGIWGWWCRMPRRTSLLTCVFCAVRTSRNVLPSDFENLMVFENLSVFQSLPCAISPSLS